ncbi:hypothetical protein FOA52_011662 [Chlamydomonas sp. UWO 241]|nr:hypothetical protein FOA52_011662 [Chlamydomonas sp. UWO 241]
MDTSAYIALGMEDKQIKERIDAINSKQWTAFWRDWWSGAKWAFPAACNGICCCCCDLTHYKEKLQTGEAYQLTYGRQDELVNVMSCPGTYHPWLDDNEDIDLTKAVPDKFTDDAGVTHPTMEGMVHTRFEEIAAESAKAAQDAEAGFGPRVVFCPIMFNDGTAKECSDRADKARAAGKHQEAAKLDEEAWRQKTVKDSGEADSKLPTEDEHKKVDLRQAYWLANIKEALADVALDTSAVKTIKIVALTGGKAGSILEQDRLAFMDKLFRNRSKMMEVVDVMLIGMQCCFSCGCSACGMSGGCNSAVTWWRILAQRVGFCMPIKTPTLEYHKVTPGSLKLYLERGSDAYQTGKHNELRPHDGNLKPAPAIKAAADHRAGSAPGGNYSSVAPDMQRVHATEMSAPSQQQMPLPEWSKVDGPATTQA